MTPRPVVRARWAMFTGITLSPDDLYIPIMENVLRTVWAAVRDMEPLP